LTHKQRIVVDRLIGVPAAIVFNGVARLLGKVIRRDHSIGPDNVKRIVVAKLIGMGSILQATPLLNALKQKYPRAKITFVTLRANEELARRLDAVDETLTLDDGNVVAMAITTIQTILALIRRRVDLYFDLEVYSAFASLLALWAVTRNRAGFYRYSTAFKKGIYTHLVFFNTRMPVRRLYLQLGRVAGLAAGQSDVIGPIRVEEADRLGVRQTLAELPGWQAERRYIVVNANASDLLLERRWPVEHAVNAIEGLVSRGHQVALMGARSEVPFVQGLMERIAPEVRMRVVNTTGRLTLGQLLALLEGAACVLTNDTGPMHMAVALRRPTVCLFGPANPEHYGHDLPFVETLYEPVFCSPCIYEADEPPCNGKNMCMQRIEPCSVLEAVERLLNSGTEVLSIPARRRTDYLNVVSDGPDGAPLGVVERASVK